MPCQNPFNLPARLKPNLQGVISLWRRLKRVEGGMPFTDDLDLSALSSLPANPFLLSVFASPERFRFEFLCEGFRQRRRRKLYRRDFTGQIFLLFAGSRQRHGRSRRTDVSSPCRRFGTGVSRVLLPMWGNGQINMLLASIDA